MVLENSDSIFEGMSPISDELIDINLWTDLVEIFFIIKVYVSS